MKIEIRDNIPDEIAIELVGIVIRQGRISKQGDKMYYCWATEIEYDDNKYMVYVRDNRKTDCFVVTKKKERMKTIDDIIKQVNEMPFVNYDITFCDNKECPRSQECFRWQMYRIYKADKRENKRTLISMYRGGSNNCNLFSKWEQNSYERLQEELKDI